MPAGTRGWFGLYFRARVGNAFQRLRRAGETARRRDESNGRHPAAATAIADGAARRHDAMASKMSLMKNASKTQNGAPEKRAAEFSGHARDLREDALRALIRP
ncbi:hypothetical protein NB311A_12287 [Nitrobacter sp. Nb-311A]|nr:hypothetical protein NB311A_12287 [Nitrobacter sp. Nb-311A]